MAERVFRLLLALSLTGSAALFVAWSWRWPLVGDASLMHYIVFLMGRGWAPYRDFGDMNMPGSYLIERAAMRVFGWGDVGWRLFDFALLAGAGAAFFGVTRRAERCGGWLAGLFAACLFALVHGRDGLAQGGQRDLTMAVCLIAATAMLFAAVRRAGADGTASAAMGFGLGFGLLSGIAFTVKPTTLPLTLLQLAMAAVVLRRFLAAYAGSAGGRVGARLVVPAAVGWMVAPAGALVFVMRERALGAFWAGLHGIVPYYASLGHRPLPYVLTHSFSPVHALVALWVVVLALGARGFGLGGWARDWERSALVVGVVWGLANCVVQARALPYYRYPLLAFLLPLMAMDFESLGIRDQGPGIRRRMAYWLAMAGLAVGGFYLAPQSAVMVHRYRWWQTDFITSLEGELSALGGARLSGRVQCIDSVSGCGTALYRMRLEQSTGVLSDFLLFGPQSAPVVRETRGELMRAMAARPPEVIVVSSHLHIDGPDEYRKLGLWPEFAEVLATRYRLVEDWRPSRTNRWWSREEWPAGFRVYVLRGGS